MNEKTRSDWIVSILVIAIFVVGYFSYKEGFKEGQNDRSAWDIENASHFCKDSLQDEDLDNFCEVPIEHYIEDEKNVAEICINNDYIASDVCSERTLELNNNLQKKARSQFEEVQTQLDDQQDEIDNQAKELKKQKDYQDCIDLWSDYRDYIEPKKEQHCRNMYL